MLKRAGLVQACLLGAVLNATALFAGTAFAQQGCCEGGDATGANAWTEGNATSAQWPPNPPPSAAIVTTLPVKAPPPAPIPYWWTHGEIEFGGRGFVNDPNQSGSIYADTNPNNKTNGGYAYVGQKSLGKFYEYGIENPSPFGGGHVAAGTSDGLYQIDLWANNIASNFAGFSDQAYLLQASKVGEHYFWFNWDQTPHIYSTSAQTPFLGVGSNHLIWPYGQITNGTPAFLPFLQPIDLGIKRDTAAAGYRWTPPDPSRPEGYAWDVRADYSYMTRKGTQAEGIVDLGGFQPTQIPAPVDDNTQNFGASGEYAGTAPWGGKYTFKVAYNGSVYHDNMSSYTVDNPFHTTCTGTNARATSCISAQISTPPSNSADGGSVTASAELPWSSRYAGTFSYVRMEQDDSFIPMTNNATVPPVASPFGGIPWNQVNFGFINGNLGDPTSHLNGQINEILSNNVLTTKITPELTQKLTYRYYEFDNDTPRIIFPQWVSNDGVGSSSKTGNEGTLSSLTISYIKQDAGYELNWRPSPQWNFNAGGGWERYNYTQTDVDATNEFSGKASVDWKPTVWLTARASGSYSDRRYDTYGYNTFVSPVQFPTIDGFGRTNQNWFYAPAYQQFMFDNRERTKVNLALDIVAFRGVTISPTFKYQDDFYGLNPANQEGLTDSRITSWGIDVGWVVTPDLSFAASYYWEKYDQSLYNYTNSNAALFGYEAQPGTCHQPPASSTDPLVNCLLITSDKAHVNTVTAAMNYAAMPGKLDFDLRYTVSWGVDEERLVTPTAHAFTGCTSCVGVFPNDTTFFERLDAIATYKFDPVWVRSMGFNGDLKAKLRYTWERNGVSNWQNDPLAPFTPTISTNAIWLGYQNPNYNVQMIAGSLIASW